LSPTRRQWVRHIEHQVIIDRLTICYHDGNPENVRATCGLLLNKRYQHDIPGIKITRNGRYSVSAKIPVPFTTQSADRHPIWFEAGPRLPGLSSYRLDFNPTKLSQQGLDDLRVFLDMTIDPTPEEFFSLGSVTRVDAAIDIIGPTLGDLIVLTERKQKRGVYSDRHGIPETVYLGTPRTARIVAYTKVNEQSARVGTRLECREKPQCLGRHIAALPNPFKKIHLFRAHVLDNLVRGVPGQLIADSIRLRGVNRTIQVLSAKQRQRVIAALTTRSLLPNVDQLWAGWPDALLRVGLATELGVVRPDLHQAA
jgi:hypothetical protein